MRHQMIGLCAAALLAPQAWAVDADALRAALEAKRKEVKAEGALVGVYLKGEKPMEFALGAADVKAGTPMARGMHFRIASVSKVFVGTAVLVLAGEGRLSLDDAISKYVKGVPNGDKVTLRHLGTHRSGLFNHIESKTVKDKLAADPAKWWTNEELLAVPLKAKTYFEPDGGHHYSNANTVLLALALEKAGGKPWADVVREKVIAPLGLKHTTVPTDNKLPAPFARGYALGQKDGPFFKRGDVRHDVTDTSPSWWGPSGSMISTLGDLAKAAKPLATGALLKPALVKELHGWTKADQAGFEYGFHVERVKGLIGHDGDVPGYQTLMYYSPEHDATVVAMTNLYGWSVRGMPANQLGLLAVESAFPKPR